jgi:hypothetical protein
MKAGAYVPVMPLDRMAPGQTGTANDAHCEVGDCNGMVADGVLGHRKGWTEVGALGVGGVIPRGRRTEESRFGLGEKHFHFTDGALHDGK